MFNADEIILESAARRLKDCDIAERRRILQAILVKITIHHPAWENVTAQLALMDGHKNLEEQLPLKFAAPALSHTRLSKHRISSFN
jgi:hypothetical protein